MLKPKLAKELALPTEREKQKNLPRFATIKSADTQSDTKIN
jgi:hypothetical protein